MKYLNLTGGFNPYNVDEKHCIRFNSFIFSGGEPHIKLDVRDLNDENLIIITQRIKSFQDLGLLMCAVDAIRRSSDTLYMPGIQLFIPYFPGARQDRVMVPGEPLTVKIYADIINALNFTSVTIFDSHSEVAPALLNSCSNINNHQFVRKCLQDIHPSPRISSPVLISPDSGANKKIKDLAVYLNSINPISVVKCDKTRNVKTGSIDGFEVYVNDFAGQHCVVVDDLCDGGGTFIGLAKELKAKNAGDLYLIVSHGIFSKGFKELKQYYKGIYTTDSWRSDISMETPEIEKGSEIVKAIKLKDIV